MPTDAVIFGAICGLLGIVIKTVVDALAAKDQRNYLGNRERIERLEEKVDAVSKELDGWKVRYYTLLRNYNTVIVRLQQLGVEVLPDNKEL